MADTISDLGAGKFNVILYAIAILWTLSAPVFFVMPDSIDGIYDRYLGFLATVFVWTMSALFLVHAKQGS